LALSFDRLAEIYDKTRGLPHVTMEKVVRVLVNGLKECGNILDAGVGTGRFAKPLQDLGFKVVGIVVSTTMLKSS